MARQPSPTLIIGPSNWLITLSQHIFLLQPLGLHTQPGQRGLAQRVEGTLASPALVALQAAGAAVANDPRAGAMGASRQPGEPQVHELPYLGPVDPGAQRTEQLHPLGWRQPRHRRQPPLQFCRIHRKLQKPTTRGHGAKSGAEVAHGVSHHELMSKEQPPDHPAGSKLREARGQHR